MSNFGQPIGLAPDLVPQEPARPQTQLPGIGIGIAPDLAGAAPQQADADRERQLLDAFRRAVNTDPTFEAEAMVHAKELGVARAAVSANPEIARRMVKQKALQYAELKRSFPTLLERFSDVEFASVAHDDLGNLKATESDFDWMRRQFGSGRAQTQRGYLGVRKALGWLTPEEQRDLDNVDLRVAGGDGKGFAASTLQVVGQMSDTIPLALGAGAAAGLAGSAAGPGGAATGFTIGSGTAAFTQSAMIEGGNAYLDMVDKGIDPETAAKAAFGVIAPLNGALELVGLKYFAAPFRASFGREAVKQLSKNLTRETAQSAFNKFAREYAKGVLGEVGTEALQELVTMAASNVAQSSSRPDLPEQTWGEMGQQVADVVAKTSQAMATIALPGPSLHLWADGRRAAAATHSAKFFTELSTKVKESKLRERAPDALHGFIAKAAEGGDASTIFVDAAKLQEVLRQQELTTDNLADLVPEVAKQVEAAAAAGEDVQVPTADFAMKLAGTKLGDALIPHMRLDPESRSLADAEVFRQGEKERSAEAQQILQQQEVENREFVRQAELVEGSLRQQLGAAGKMPANEAVAAAKFYRDIVVTQANRAGMLPEAFVAKYPLRVLASDAAAAGDLQQFAGTMSHTADMTAGKQAFDRLAAGEDAEIVRRETGWHRGADGGMRYEIDDSMATFNAAMRTDKLKFGDAIAKLSPDSPVVKLSDVMSHPKLFAAYPWLADLTVSSMAGGSSERGRFSPGRSDRPGRIDISEDLYGIIAFDVLLHEVQHAIQKAEGWSAGADPAKVGAERYRRNANEVEARNTAERRFMSGQERRDSSPEFTADVKAGDVLWQPDGGKAPRASYRPADFTVFLHQKADASSFLHELSHHYLHVLADLASQPDAAPAIAADMQQLLDWFGVADLATWNALTLEQQRKHHEAFAYSFELYLFEGKAPSQALAGLFQRFARWLRRVYTTIRGELNTAYRKETGEDLPVLTPEVRGVMDRMAASDKEIALQSSIRNLAPQFATQAESGMNDADWASYQQLLGEQSDAATAELTQDSLKQMQWLSGARAGLLRRMQQKHDALRGKVRDQVAAVVEQRPVYRAIAWLRDGPAAAEGSEGATQDDGGSHRLASDAVRKLLPEGAKLGGVWRAITEKKGLAPDLVARLHGFRTGEDLVNAIADAPALEAAIDTETDARMLAEHSDLADPQKRDLAVQAALHNEARTRFLGAELRHLAKATQPVRLMIQAARDMAGRLLSAKQVGQIQPREHTVAEERARRESIQAMRRGESERAAELKRQELLQHHLAKGAIEARDEIDEALEQFEKLWDSDEKIGKARSIEHVAAARAILAHYGLGRGGKTPAQHMAQAHAYDSEVAQELQPLVDRMGAAAGKNSWRSVTLDEFRVMREAVEQLWFQGRRANEMMVEGRRVRIAAAAGELAARLEEIGLPKRAPGDRGTETAGEQFQREGLLAGFASVTRVEHWAESLGPVFVRYVFRPISDGLTAYRKDRNVYVQRYEQMLRAHREAGHLSLDDIAAPELNGHVFHGKPELLGALLHTGNRSNLRKLVAGWKGWAKWDDGPDSFDTSGWDAFQARMVQKGVLTKADFDFVQAVWDMNEGLKPQLQETHRGLYGHYFEEVQATEIPTQWGVYRGGYVPASADTTEQNTALHQQLAELQGDYRNVVPAVQRGFTKSRTDITRRLTLDIRRQAGHLDQVLRFAHVQPAVRDVLAVLKHRDLAGTLHRWNPALMDKLLLPWLNRAASGLTTEPAKNKEVGRWLTKLRQNAGLAIMAGNVVNAAQNLAGILTARTLVAGRDLRASLFEVVGSPRETAASIAARSPFMANRMEGRIHELTSSIDELARGRGWLGKANELAGRYGYVMQKKTQGFVDQVVWIGAYNQAMREQSAAVGDKEAEATAVARADSVVRRTQGSQEAEDVSAYETGTPLWKAFVQFGSWFNNNANLNASEWVRLKRELGWRGVVGTRAGALALWGFLLPTLAASWIQQFLGAGWDDEDDDGMGDEYVGWFFASQGRALLASVPMAGAAGLTVWNFLDDKGFNDRMPQPAVLSIPERGLKALMGLDGGVTGTRVRDVLTFASTLVGVPLTVAGRPLGYAMSVDEGKVQPTGPVDFARGLVTGQASAESKR